MHDDDLPLVIDLPVERRSLRVAVVTETYPPEVNGVASTVARFVQGLRARHHEVQLVRPRQGAADRPGGDACFQEVLRAGMPIPRYPNLRMGLPSVRALTRLWLHRRPDVVHVVTEGPLGWSALQAALKLGVPVSSDLRTNFHAYSRHYGIGWLHRPIESYLRRFHNRTARTLVPTETMRRDLSTRGFRNLEVVARGVDAALFHPGRRSESLRAAWGAQARDPVVIHVGRLAPEKNLGALGTSFAAIRRVVPHARFVVVGDGPARAALERDCPFAVFAGERRGEDLAAHYASGDVFVFPSLTETFGNVTLEAMASGLAVAAFDYAAAAEHLRAPEAGALAPFGDVEALARAGVTLCRDPACIARLGRAARTKAESLSWEAVSERFAAILIEVASDGTGTPGRATPRGRAATA